MKHLFNFLIIFSAVIHAGISQSSLAHNENHFVQERIGETFNQISAVEGNIQVIFHNDRIELLTEGDGENQFFFIKLNNVSFDMPEGDGMISREVVPVANQSMANVLGSSTVEKSYFKTISYTDKLTGESIVVSMDGNKIEFNGLNESPLELQLWGDAGESNSKRNNVQLERFGKTIELSSKNSELNKNENKISFKQNGGKDNANLHLSITIL